MDIWEVKGYILRRIRELTHDIAMAKLEDREHLLAKLEELQDLQNEL